MCPTECGLHLSLDRELEAGDPVDAEKNTESADLI